MVVVKVVVNNSELRRVRVSDSRLDSSFRTLIDAIRPAVSGASPAMTRRSREWRLEYQDDEGDRITVTSDVELREAIRVATENKRTLRLFAWSSIKGEPTVVIPAGKMIDWDDDDYDDVDDEDVEPGTSREGAQTPGRPPVHPPKTPAKSSFAPDPKLPMISSTLVEAKREPAPASSGIAAELREAKRDKFACPPSYDDYEEESPFTPLVRAHVRRTLQCFNDYYQGMLSEHHAEQNRIKDAVAQRIASEANNGMEGELNLVETHLREIKDLNERFSDSVAVLLSRYEQHMASLPPCPFLLPIVVTLYASPASSAGSDFAAPPMFIFEQVSLRPTDTIASLRNLFRKKIAESGSNATVPQSARILLHRPIRDRIEPDHNTTEPVKKTFAERLFGRKERKSPERQKSPPRSGTPNTGSPKLGPVPANPSIERLTYDLIYYDDESACLGDLPLPWGSHVSCDGIIPGKPSDSKSSINAIANVITPVNAGIISSSYGAAARHKNNTPPVSPQLAPFSFNNQPPMPPISLSMGAQPAASLSSSSLSSSPPTASSSSVLLASAKKASSPTSSVGNVTPLMGSSLISSSSLPPFSLSGGSVSPTRAATPLVPTFSPPSADAFGQATPAVPNVIERRPSSAISSSSVAPYSLLFSPMPLSKEYAAHKQLAMQHMVEAVTIGDAARFQAAVEEGADVHAVLPGGLGWTVLHRASALGHRTIVAYLLSEKCARLRVAIDAKDLQGWTPLMRACKAGHAEVVRLLIAAKANTQIRNNSGQNALGIAALSNNILAIDILTTARKGPTQRKEGEPSEFKEEDEPEEKAALGNGVVSGSANTGSSPLVKAVVAAVNATSGVTDATTGAWQQLLLEGKKENHPSVVAVPVISDKDLLASSPSSLSSVFRKDKDEENDDFTPVAHDEVSGEMARGEVNGRRASAVKPPEELKRVNSPPTSVTATIPTSSVTSPVPAAASSPAVPPVPRAQSESNESAPHPPIPMVRRRSSTGSKALTLLGLASLPFIAATPLPIQPLLSIISAVEESNHELP